jgi:hypothetical protein
MNGLVKKKQFYDKNPDATQLLSSEILGSLLNKFKIVMDKKFKKNCNHLKKFSLIKNLKYFQELQIDEIKNIIQLGCYFNLPLNNVNESPIQNSSNILQLMLDTKKHKLSDNDLVIYLWNLLKK